MGRSSLANSSCAAAISSAWSMQPPASAALNAALSAMLRMLPPGRLSRASAAKSISPSGALARELTPPDLLARRCVGKREADDEADAAQEGAVERALHVGGEDRQAAIGLDPLQQVGDLDVGVAVVAVLDLAALAEERVGLVEQQHRAAGLGGVEQALQVLLGLADVLADHASPDRRGRGRARARWRSLRRPASCRCRFRRRTAREALAARGASRRSPSPRRRVRGGAAGAAMSRSMCASGRRAARGRRSRARVSMRCASASSPPRAASRAAGQTAAARRQVGGAAIRSGDASSAAAPRWNCRRRGRARHAGSIVARAPRRALPARQQRAARAAASGAGTRSAAPGRLRQRGQARDRRRRARRTAPRSRAARPSAPLELAHVDARGRAPRRSAPPRDRHARASTASTPGRRADRVPRSRERGRDSCASARPAHVAGARRVLLADRAARRSARRSSTASRRGDAPDERRIAASGRGSPRRGSPRRPALVGRRDPGEEMQDALVDPQRRWVRSPPARARPSASGAAAHRARARPNAAPAASPARGRSVARGDPPAF